MKVTFRLLMALFVIAFFTTACNSLDELTPSNNSNNYESYNETVVSYFEALVEGNYNKMKNYLPDEEIQGDSNFANAKEDDTPEKTDVLQEMGDKYSIKGFDFFYESHGEIYYSIEYYNSRSGHERQPLVIGVKESGDDYYVINKYGHNRIPLLHLKEIDGDFTPMGFKDILNKYPDNVFVVKEYPET